MSRLVRMSRRVFLTDLGKGAAAAVVWTAILPACSDDGVGDDSAQPIAGVDKARGEALRRRWIKLADIDADSLHMRERLARPDYARQESGNGVSSGVPHFSSHPATLLWSTTRPAAMSSSARRSAAFSAASLSSKIARSCFMPRI